MSCKVPNCRCFSNFRTKNHRREHGDAVFALLGEDVSNGALCLAYPEIVSSCWLIALTLEKANTDKLFAAIDHGFAEPHCALFC